MKKNRTMRLAALLLVLTLITSCFVGGTFARYITTANGSDDARVAEWGVTITTTTDGLFADTYKNDEEIGTTIAVNAGNSVDAEGDDVVAPGTEGSITFGISGQPEVAVKVDITMDVASDVIIPANTEIASGNTLSEAYTPVVFTLTDAAGTTIATGTLSQIKTGLEGLSASYEPNEDLEETYTLSWAWAINGNNAADTYLGNVAAGTETDDNTKTEIDFDFSITVTQID